jgi:hypothetical protein
VVSALDLPSEPEETARAERARGNSADRPLAPETPDPDERGQAYEAMRARVSAETRNEAEPDRPADGTDNRSYWTEVPRLLDLRADLEERWPTKRRPVVDRSADPPGSYRSDGGFYLNPDRHAEAVAMIGRVHEVERTISADMQRVKQENSHGAWLEGFKCRLKGGDRLKEKVAEQLKAEPNTPTGEVLGEVPDAIRYTFCLEPENYSRGYYDIKEHLESVGYEMYLSKNTWGSRQYKGINTRWVTQGGQRFEVQFHTAESFHAKHYITHDAYERIRNPMTSDGERSELRDFQREVSSTIRVPDGATNIPDYEKKGF